ncbi:MAG TPA: hypothetical protein VFD91_06755 [Mariniphaga sp.]|nr:hypothetical protein [Mariniphaga sp.]
MRNRKLLFTTIAGILAAAFTSCIDDPEPAPLDAMSDAYIQKKVEDGVEKYALGLWVLANKNLDTVIVEGPEDETWELSAENENDLRVFRYKIEDEDYTETIPAEGDYSFKVTSTQEGETPITVKDKLTDKVLDVATIDSTKFTNSGLDVHWQVVSNADNYVIRMFDEDDKMIYQGPYQLGNKDKFTVEKTGNYWATGFSPQEGDTYRLELLAILFETGISESEEMYNVQSISIATSEIEWED